MLEVYHIANFMSSVFYIVLNIFFFREFLGIDLREDLPYNNGNRESGVNYALS